MSIVIFYFIGAFLGFFIVFYSLNDSPYEYDERPEAAVSYCIGFMLSWVTVGIYLYNKINNYVNKN